ncbi:hypothetical protein LEL_00145 [Akanthomyces lecanii RCEF 1005]|uniref:F-box domain-containing protein n=1 Tax=Akanthomyces lecanii RCEF 1005 TaxID=1081108 RepID=A0A168JLH3_CORDF|nr:hypothetical protein LEL_00145 [Akanthomyces lecanii RCEF 1005]
MAPKSLVKLIMETVRIHNRSRPSSAGTEPALSKSGGSEPTGSETTVSPNSRLLNMPVEVILKLTDFLPHRDRVLLSLTCTDMPLSTSTPLLTQQTAGKDPLVHRSRNFRLGHSHVQLAVKFSRLEKSMPKAYQRYFKALLERDTKREETENILL